MMKKWQLWVESLSHEDQMWLTAVFVAAMLGTMVSSMILSWGMHYYGHSTVLAKLMVCLLATAAYALAAGSVFYILFPEKRTVFKRLFIRK
ncbi:MAG: hypothetical protein H6657_29165 [Ardenticatenaceae bacterium]|nr:hypothetical protein [Anaerolineales bacterium]MCB8981496.1 hypothetical protein [Ardenticatenaceae bacterium]